MFQGQPGAPYRPSNGTEGEGFQSRWCEGCERDRYDSKPCRILGYSMAFNLGDTDYPKQLVYDADGHASCTAFEAIGSRKRKRRARVIRDGRQTALTV